MKAFIVMPARSFHHVVVANTKQEAIAIVQNSIGDYTEPLDIEEIEIRHGTIITALGYDETNTWISVEEAYKSV